MARLPQPGGDNGNWGSILNEYLSQALKSDGRIKDNAVTSNTIAPNSITNAAIASDAVNAVSIADGSITNALLADGTIQEAKLSSAVQTKLNAGTSSPDWNSITNKPAVIAAGTDQVAARTAIGAGTSNLIIGTTSSTAKAGDYTPTKADVGLGSADNTSDANKPISSATQSVLDSKVDKNASIIPATKTKLTYDANGLVTAGTDATTADVNDSTDRRYITEAQKIVINNTTGINTGDQDLSSYVPTSRTVNSHALSADVIVTKSDIGLGSVDNTSDITKNSATATLTNKMIDGATNTLQNIPESAVSNLVTDLTAKQSQLDWSLRRIGNTTIPARRTNFVSQTNTTTPSTTDDTGQTVVHTGVNTPGYSIISGGKWTIPATPGTGKFYAYRYWQDSANVTRVGMRFSFDNISGARTTTIGSVVMGISNGPWDLNDPNVNNFKFGTHLFIHSTDWGAFTYRYDTQTFHTIASGTFATPLLSDGTIYEAEVYRVGNTMTMVLPDGTVKTATDPEVGSWSTNWAWIEATVDNHDTDNIPSVYEYWSDTAVQRVPLTEGTPQAGFARNTPYTTIKDANFTILDDVDATKKAQFQLSGITTGNTRTLTIPDASTTIVGTNASQTLTNKTLTSPIISGLVTGSGVAATATASTLAVRDLNANLLADAFIPGFTTTATAGGITTLTVDSTETQLFTGTTTQTVTLPTSGIVAGQKYTIISNGSGSVTVTSSNGNTVGTLAGTVATFISNIAVPTTQVHWTVSGMLPVGGLYVDSGVGPWTSAQRNNEGNLKADSFIPSLTSTATAAGTTVLTIDSTEVQVFTGTTTQTVTLPTSGVAAGQRYTIVNSSTGNVTVNASAGGLTDTLSANNTATLVALQATPTLPAHWAVIGNFPTTGSYYKQAASAFTLVQRDAQSNIISDAFIPGFTSTATAAGTTTLTVDSTEQQLFTGTSTQTLVLPTTGIVAGQRFSITNTSSGGSVAIQTSDLSAVDSIQNNQTAIVTALQATPTSPGHWSLSMLTNRPPRTTSQANSMAQRDGNANLFSDAFVPGFTSTTTTSGTTTLTVDSTEVQLFIGSLNQTLVLPTTNIVAGQRYSIINSSSSTITINASGGSNVTALAAGFATILIAAQAAPTLNTQWSSTYQPLSGSISTAVSVSTIPRRDASANLLANAFIPNFTTTATAAGTTTLTVGSSEIQVFTGSTTQTVALPTTSIVAGQRYTIINSSTGAVTVQSSGANTITTLAANTAGTFTAVVATPTIAANWYVPPTGSGDMLRSTYDPANISQQVVGTTASQTLTNKTFTAPIINTGINTQTGTTYTLVLSDAGQLVTLSNAASITMTIPLNSSVAYAVGARIDIAQLGAGQVTVAPTAGVTINSTPGLKLSTQYSGATLTKLATDTWLLVGDLSA